MIDLKDFHSKFYDQKDKIGQDHFMLKHIETRNVKRRRTFNEAYSPRLVQSKYFIRNRQNMLIPVCLKTFLNTLNVSRFRVNLLAKQFHMTGEMPLERRGGNRKEILFEAKRNQVISFISKLVAVEAHYCRSNLSCRQYLSSELSIKKLSQLYNEEQVDASLKVKNSYFRSVFNENFNLGFGSPRTDVCSYCLELSEKLKTEKNPQQKQNLMVQKRIHKLKAQCFFDLLRSKDENTLILSFDCQKNLPLPKIPDQAAYYSRQIYLFNFTIVKGHSKGDLNPTTVWAYCWTENQYNKGSNEIASCVYDFLQNADVSQYHTIRLICDGCGGQNKNSVMVAMCCSWLSKAPPNVKTIQLVFPVTGHSFIPPDRVFGNIEKKIRKREVITTPDEYLDIISESATVKKLGRDCQVYDWKSAKEQVLKLPGSWHFQIKHCKRIFITRTISNEKILVQGEVTYRNFLGSPKSLLKRGKTLLQLVPKMIETGKVALKQEKLDNVNTLLSKHYGDQWRDLAELRFYQNIVDQPPAINQNPIEDDVAFCEYSEELPEFRV